MIKLFVLSIYGKHPLKNFLLRTGMAEDLKTWYAALGGLWPYQVCSNGDHCPSLYMKSKQHIKI